MSELSGRTRYFLDALLKIIITLVAAAVPLFIAHQLNTTQKMKEFVELYDLINSERSMETKKELLRLWAEMNPGQHAEQTIVSLLKELDNSTRVLASNTEQTLEAMRELNDQLSQRGELSAEQINTLNSNLEKYYVFQGNIMDRYDLGSRFSDIPRAPNYVGSEELKTLTEILEEWEKSPTLNPELLKQALPGVNVTPWSPQTFQAPDSSPLLQLHDSQALQQALPGWDLSDD